MARWTNWRMIASRRDWFDDALDWDGPACYELALGGPRGGGLHIVYVGETLNEKRRVAAYARHGSHLSEIIDRHLRDGWHLHYRARAVSSKRAAVAMQDNLLARWEYDWNIQLNER
jgi:hypothetical protein